MTLKKGNINFKNIKCSLTYYILLVAVQPNVIRTKIRIYGKNHYNVDKVNFLLYTKYKGIFKVMDEDKKTT